MHKRFLVWVVLAGLIPGLLAQGLETTAKADDWEEINFEFDSAILSDGYPSLLRLAELLQKNPGYRVKVDGHTDWIGSSGYNEKLGMARANTVKSFLEKYGARANQIEVSTGGKRVPKVDNRTKEGRFMNRRVILTVFDDKGNVVGAGGVGQAIRAMPGQQASVGPNCCTEILTRLDKLDDILRLLQGLTEENAKLRKDVDALMAKQTQPAPPPPQPAVNVPSAEQVAEKIEARQPRRFSLLGMNLGSDMDGKLTFTGKGRFFAPFKNNFAFQSEAEYLYFRDRKEGQFDFGLVNRYNRFQAGLFGSFKHVTFNGFQSGATLGQGSVTLDYLFNRGRIGLFGSKGFMDRDVVNRLVISRNIVDETYVRVVDQVGGAGSVGLWGRSYLEGNLGFLRSRLNDNNKAGGTFRLVQPLNDRFAFTLEGGFNETLVGRDNNGRVVAGILFGNFIRPKEFLQLDHPVPADIPRIRYELLTRRVRTGNDPPVADAGPDQTGVAAGTITLDGSASFDPDGDPITYQWSQIAGPQVTLATPTAVRTTFAAAEGQAYAFRLTVRDDKGAQSIARVSITTRSADPVRIVRFQANPASIQAGGRTTIVWEVLNAETVDITGIGRVDPKQGTSQVSLRETTTFRITARNRTSEASESLVVEVQRPQVRIISFIANPVTIPRGQSSTLTWVTENATRVEITSLGMVSGNGSSAVSPTENATYTIRASNEFSEASASVTVTVTDPTPGLQRPRIIRFDSNPQTIPAGSRSTLTWLVENADEVTISPGVGNVALTGSREVSPGATTTYTILARNPVGEASATAVVSVGPAQVDPVSITDCLATPATVRAGEPAVLTWTARNASRVVLSGVGNVTSPFTVRPQQTTNYTLVAFGDSGSQATCSIRVTIDTTPPPPVNPPVAVIAGGPLRETIYRENLLDASGSTSPDGSLPLRFRWRAVNRTAVILRPDTATPTVQLGEQFGDYIFEVTVTDSKGASSTAQIVLRLVGTRIF